jgi:hypothetical protein
MVDAAVQARLQMNPIHDTRRRLVVMKKVRNSPGASLRATP